MPGMLWSGEGGGTGSPRPFMPGAISRAKKGVDPGWGFFSCVRSRELKSFPREHSQTSEWEAGKDPACRYEFQRLISL